MSRRRSKQLTPPPTLPEQMPPARSRYYRPRRPFSWWGLAIGLIIGLGMGLVYAWVENPIVEVSTEPWQLRSDDRALYMVGVALAFAGDSDLNRAVDRLLTLQSEGEARDPFQEMANTACQLASTGYVDSNSGLRAIRSMMTFYQLQGRTGCADTLIPASNLEPTAVVQVELPTPTLRPPATKTPTPDSAPNLTPTQRVIVVPTSVPQRDFVLADIATFCNANLPGVIEVFVQDFGSVGLPGQPVQVRWDSGRSRFFTGLKPERGPGYADFQMEEGRGYIVEIPGRSDPTQPLTAGTCTAENGQRSITSFRVFFLPAR